MPILGYGVFQVSPQAYANEEGVGATTATASASSPRNRMPRAWIRKTAKIDKWLGEIGV